MQVSKREFYWACSKVIPKILDAKLKGVQFNIPDMVRSFSQAYIEQKAYIPEDQAWAINVAADTVSVIANQLATKARFSFSDDDSFCWTILSNKEQSSFMETYGHLLKDANAVAQ